MENLLSNSRMKAAPLFVAGFEWSETPYHQGTFCVFLRYSSASKRWSLTSSHSPSSKRLSWGLGRKEEAPRAVAIELLRKSHSRGALEFDLISDQGPYGISIKDIVPRPPPSDRVAKTSAVKQRTCEFCYFLERPQGVAALRARAFDCGLGNWPREVREAERTNCGAWQPNLSFSCDEFEPNE